MPLPNPIKASIRKWIKAHVFEGLSAREMARQSRIITQKVLNSDHFHYSQRISMYLSLPHEVDTWLIMNECFRLKKHVFVPTYEGRRMEMVYLNNINDYNSLCQTNRKIKQPPFWDKRENALLNGHGIDLFLICGYAFSEQGGRVGHHYNFYNNYLRRHKCTYPHKRCTYMGLAFLQQMLHERNMGLDPHDVRMHTVVTA